MAKSGTTILGDKKFRQAMLVLNFGPLHVTTGVHAEDDGRSKNRDPERPVGNVMRARAHEFGLGGQHQRSFLRSTVNEQHRQITKRIVNEVGKAMDGKQNLEKAMHRVGLDAQARVRKKITDITSPPNSKEWIAVKGSSNPLIDYGEMRMAIKSKVNKGPPPKEGDE